VLIFSELSTDTNGLASSLRVVDVIPATRQSLHQIHTLALALGREHGAQATDQVQARETKVLDGTRDEAASRAGTRRVLVTNLALQPEERIRLG
jgi:hypothetical protein